MNTREIADLLSGTLIGDPNIEIGSVADIETAGPEQIAFYQGKGALPGTRAGCVIVPTEIDAREVASVIVVKDPKLAFAQAAAVLHPGKKTAPGVHPTAMIAPTAALGNDVFIGAFVSIGENSKIGSGSQAMAGVSVGSDVSIGHNCILHPNVTVESNCILGDGVILHAGVVIGADGFGYVRDRTGYIKFPQIGTVVIENDVEIGANTCIDRGALGETRIGEGTKIDNLVQVAHNVRIGKRVIIAAQTGISGSTVIEDDCVIGGQVGMGDHARVKSGAIIGSQAGVLPGKIVRPGVWWGTPVQPLEEYKRQNAELKGISRMKAAIGELKRRIDKDASGTD
jgi:UDP-3-O-[3-hydroxymyristoyl] glucosamine N-acyltransferase